MYGDLVRLHPTLIRLSDRVSRLICYCVNKCSSKIDMSFIILHYPQLYTGRHQPTGDKESVHG